MGLLYKEIALASRYLTSDIVGKKRSAKRFLASVRKWMQTQHKKDFTIVSFFYDTAQGKLILYAKYKGIDHLIGVRWKKTAILIEDKQLPLIIINHIKRILSYYIPVEKAGSGICGGLATREMWVTATNL